MSIDLSQIQSLVAQSSFANDDVLVTIDNWLKLLPAGIGNLVQDLEDTFGRAFDEVKHRKTDADVPTPELPMSETSYEPPSAEPPDHRYDSYKMGYEHLWANCQLNSSKKGTIDWYSNKVIAGESEYKKIGGPLGVPWYFLGIIHGMECGFNFKKNLAQGDSLNAYSHHVPKGTPKVGHGPPFTFEEAATYALKIQHFANHPDWSPPRMLYRWELYNGLGYRNHGVNSAYLWSGTNEYSHGKYIADGVWSSSAISQQMGTAAVLKDLVEKGVVSL